MNCVKKFILAIVAIVIGAASANAQFMDTGKADNFFRIGLRAGLNMSNASTGGKSFLWNHSSWGTGFDGGVVAEIAFREWFVIQPGFFYQSRSNSYTHILALTPDTKTETGHTLYYSFYIPIIFQARFNVTERLRWSVDAGPYLSLGLGHNDTGLNLTPSPAEEYDYGYYDRHKRNVWGLKFGTGLELNEHYYLGIHYMAGFGNAWKVKPYKGTNKAWSFTLGYNF